MDEFSEYEAQQILDEEKVITVCDQCLRACCWQGMFMCDDNQSAGTVDKTVRELRAIPDDGNREHEDFWREKP